MKLHFKSWRWLAIAALVILGAGCSGINSRQSISPASFFLPGLLQADPPAAAPGLNRPAAGAEPQFAQAR